MPSLPRFSIAAFERAEEVALLERFHQAGDGAPSPQAHPGASSILAVMKTIGGGGPSSSNRS